MARLFVPSKGTNRTLRVTWILTFPGSLFGPIGATVQTMVLIIVAVAVIL